MNLELYRVQLALSGNIGFVLDRTRMLRKTTVFFGNQKHDLMNFKIKR